MIEDHQDGGDQQEQDEHPAPGTLGTLAVDFGAQPHLAPFLGPRFERVARPSKSSQSQHGQCIYPF
jgi:hypothetical protein